MDSWNCVVCFGFTRNPCYGEMIFWFDIINEMRKSKQHEPLRMNDCVSTNTFIRMEQDVTYTPKNILITGGAGFMYLWMQRGLIIQRFPCCDSACEKVPAIQDREHGLFGLLRNPQQLEGGGELAELQVCRGNQRWHSLKNRETLWVPALCVTFWRARRSTRLCILRRRAMSVKRNGFRSS